MNMWRTKYHAGSAGRRAGERMPFLGIVLGLCLAATGLARADLINAQFYRVDQSGVAFSGAATLGSPGDQWNSLQMDNNPHVYQPITNSAGAVVTGVTITFNNGYGGNDWGNGDYWTSDFYMSSTSPYWDLMRNNAHNVNITVTGLPPGNYDLFLYHNNKHQQAPQVWANGVVKTLVPSLTGPALRLGRDVLVFKGVVVGSNGNLNFYRSGGGEYLPCGFQLTESGPNTAPTGGDYTNAIAQNSYHIFAASEFGFADANIGDELVKIKVTQLPVEGALTLSGGAVLLNQVIAVADLNVGNLRFTPATDATGTPYDTFQFLVSDGSDYSVATNTMTLNVYDQAGLINVKFKAAADPDYSGAGVFGSNQWNNLVMSGWSQSPHFEAIVASNGAPTGVRVNFNGTPEVNWNWGTGEYDCWSQADYQPVVRVGAASPYFDLLRSSVRQPNFTVNGLTPGAYDVVIYLSARSHQQTVRRVNGVDQYAGFYADGYGVQGGDPLVLSRDYVAYKGVVVGADGVLNTYRSGGNDQELVCGFQLRPAAVNAVPTGADNTRSIAMNAYVTFAAADFGFADDDTQDALQTVKVTALPAAGTLTLNGASVLVNQAITVSDLRAGKLRFTPAADATGTPYDSFQFKVSDGTDYSAAANTMTINVYAQAGLISVKFKATADPEYSGSGVFGSNQWNNLVMSGWDNYHYPHFASIVDSNGAPTGVSVDFQGVPEVNWNWGTGEYDCWSQADYQPVVHVGTSSPYFDLLRSSVRQPNFTVNGLTPGAYDVVIYLSARSHQQSIRRANGIDQYAGFYADGYGVQGGAPLLLSRDYVAYKGVVVGANGVLNTYRSGGNDQELVCGFQLRPAAVNAVPTGADNTRSIAMNAYVTFAAGDFGFADDDTQDALQAVKVTALPAAGTLTLNGASVLVNQAITVSDLRTGKLRFTPAPYATGTPYDSFQFKVSDGADYSATANTMAINVYARSALISVNFRASGDSDYAGSGASGAGQWNNLNMSGWDNYHYPHFTSILASNGAPTGVSVDFAGAPEVNWNWGSTAFTTWGGPVIDGSSPYFDLLRSYLRQPNFTVNGLTPGLYDFYIYVNSRPNQQFTRWVNTATLNNSSSATAALAEGRDYLAYRGVLVGADGRLQTYRIGGSDQELISGFQLKPAGVTVNAATNTVFMMQDSIHTFTTAEFVFAGLDIGDTNATVKVTQLPASGTLATNGAAVVLDEDISIMALVAGSMTFTPGAGQTGTPYANFLFQVSDGVAYSGTDAQMTINVTTAPPAVLISAKYRHSNEGDATFSGAALLGAPGDLWNDIDDNGHNGQAWTYAPITDTTGATMPGVSVTITNNYWGNNAWGSGAYNAGGQFSVNSGSTPFYDLLRTYFGGEPQTWIKGLVPGASYDLVVYLHTHDNRRISVNANGTEIYGSYALPGAPIVIGRDAIVFKGVTADGSGNIVFYRQNGDNGLFSGFQLQPAGANSAPTAADGTNTIAMSFYKVFSAGDFNYDDADPLDALAQIQITQLPTLGALLLSGNPVLLNQAIPVVDLNAGNLRFVPVIGATGTPYDTFQFKVNDGTEYSSSTNTMTINVLPQFSRLDIQFYRVLSGDTAFGPGAAVIGAGGDQWNNLDMGNNPGYGPSFTSIHDVDGEPTGVTVDFAGYPAVDDWGNGAYNTWGQYDVVPGFTVNSASSAYYDLLRSYVADPDVYLHGLTPGSYDVFVLLHQRENRQQGVTLHGVATVSKPYGQNVSTQAGAPLVLNRDYVLFKNFAVGADGTLRINRQAYERLTLSGIQLRPASSNASPTGADSTLTMAKNLIHTMTVAEFGFADADTGDELQNIMVTQLPMAGDLLLSGAAVLPNQVIVLADLKAGNLKYVPATDGTGSPYDSFGFMVSDGVAYSVAANTLTFNVAPQASLINIQFYKSLNGDVAFGPGMAVIGEASNQWNNLDMPVNDGQYAPHFTSIMDVNGDPTGVTVDFAGYPAVDDWGNGAYNTWGQYDVVPSFNVNSGSSAYYDLLRSYVADPDVYLHGLTPGSYDVFVLLHQRENRQQGVTLHGVATVSKPYGQNVSTQAGAPLILNRDYVLFKDFIVGSDGTLRINRQAYDRLTLSGIQLRPAMGNTAPTGTDRTIAISENSTHTFTVAEFGFADADAGDQLLNIQVTAIPTLGSLFGPMGLGDGGAVLLNQVISLADLIAGNLHYKPATDGTGSPYDTFQFKVSDGALYSTAPNTLTFDVVAQAMLINVQFYRSANGDTAFGPGAAVIGTAGDQWNNLDMPDNDGQNAPRFTSIVDADGNPTGVTVDFAGYPAIDDWGNGAYTTWDGYNVNSGSTFYDLLRSYVADPDVTVHGLTPGVYDLVVLVHQRDNRTQGITVNGVSKAYGSGQSVSGAGAPLVENRDYVVFNGVVVGADGAMRFNRQAYDRLTLSGFQLVPGYDAYFTATPTSGDADLEVTFTDTSVDGTGGTITDLFWDFGDGSSAHTTTAGGSVTHTYVDWGTYTAQLTISNTLGRVVVSATTEITVTQPCVINVTSAERYENATVDIRPCTVVNFHGGIGTFLFGGLTGRGTFALTDLGSDCVALQVGGDGPDTTFAGAMTGCGGLAKVGANVVTLSGTNTYSGETTVSNGTLRLASGSVISGFGGDGTGWTRNGSALNVPVAGDVLTMCNGSGQIGSAYRNTKVPVNQQFDVRFILDYNGDTHPADEFTFILHNTAAGLNALPNDRNTAGITPSAAITLDTWNNGTWYDTNGGTETTREHPNVLAQPLHPLIVEIGYDGVNLLTEKLTDTVNSNTYTRVYTVGSLATQVGADTAYAGFTCGVGGHGTTYSVHEFSITYGSGGGSWNILPVGTSVRMVTGGLLDLDGITNTVAGLYFDDVAQTTGTWGALSSGTEHESGFFTGTGVLIVTGSVPEPPRPEFLAGALTFTGGDSVLSFDTEAGYLYGIEYRDSLIVGDWLPLIYDPDFPLPDGWSTSASTGGVMSITDTNAASQSMRFYRIRTTNP